MAPHLETAAKKLLTGTASVEGIDENNNNDADGRIVHVGKIDGPAWRSLTFRFGVVGFPSFFHIKGADAATGREIRKLAGVESSVEGVKEAALVTWRGLPPIPWTTGPFGVLALVKFYGLKYGEKVFKLHEPIAHALDIPPIFTGFAFGLFLLAASVGLLIGFAVWLGPKKRRDEHEE
jgi:hypothetical protein